MEHLENIQKKAAEYAEKYFADVYKMFYLDGEVGGSHNGGTKVNARIASIT